MDNMVNYGSIPNQAVTPRLRRQDLAPGPLGTVGNLRFSVQDGGTAPEPRPSMRERIGSWCTELGIFCCASEEARAQHDDERKVFKDSRCIGDLLGSLTAHADNAAGQRDVVKQLTKLSKRSLGNLASLEGGGYSLPHYMGRLTDNDVRALRTGPLGVPTVRTAILNQIEPEELRVQAHHVLEQVREAFVPRREQYDTITALRTINEMPLDSMDKGRLRAQLEFVRARENQLRTYLASLLPDEVRDLKAKMAAIIEALQNQITHIKADLKKHATDISEQEQAFKTVQNICDLISLTSTIKSRFHNNEELNPDDRSLSLEVVDVKVDEPSQA